MRARVCGDHHGRAIVTSSRIGISLLTMRHAGSIQEVETLGNPQTPILLRTTSNAGHGSSTPLKERVEESAHVYAFLFDALGVTYGAP